MSRGILIVYFTSSRYSLQFYIAVVLRDVAEWLECWMVVDRSDEG
mgnify:CR=1 FL=1